MKSTNHPKSMIKQRTINTVVSRGIITVMSIKIILDHGVVQTFFADHWYTLRRVHLPSKLENILVSLTFRYHLYIRLRKSRTFLRHYEVRMYFININKIIDVSSAYFDNALAKKYNLIVFQHVLLKEKMCYDVAISS